ncbi:MAG: hypothetical protein BA066_03395 [Candidatus Korarchaeota archaeon NZ13-K]|nr:MAG: hypothetical protein BA066_03395 [Candidatus Korarchaeota archaeon NZ13-K]
MRGSEFYPLPLRNIHRLLTNLGRDADPEGVRSLLKLRDRRRVDQYVKTLRWVASRVEDAGSLDAFMESMVRALMREFWLEEAFKELMERAIPLSPSSLSALLRARGLSLTESEARAIISWMREAGALRERKVPVLTLSLEERVLEDVRNRGTVTYASLRRSYGDNAKLAVFSLWRRGLISVPSLERYRDLLEGVEDPDRIPGKVEGRIFSTWQDRTSGEMYSELVIPQRERISARWRLDA